MVLEAEEDLISCVFCKKCFDKYTLRYHIYSDANYVPIRCQLCGNREYSKSGMRKHFVEDHSGTDEAIADLSIREIDRIIQILVALSQELGKPRPSVSVFVEAKAAVLIEISHLNIHENATFEFHPASLTHFIGDLPNFLDKIEPKFCGANTARNITQGVHMEAAPINNPVTVSFPPPNDQVAEGWTFERSLDGAESTYDQQNVTNLTSSRVPPSGQNQKSPTKLCPAIHEEVDRLLFLLKERYPEDFNSTTCRLICNKCRKDAAFAGDRRTLTAHSFKHSDARPFVCKMCQKTFNWVSCYETHMRQIHSAPRRIWKDFLEDGSGDATIIAQFRQCFNEFSTVILPNGAELQHVPAVQPPRNENYSGGNLMEHNNVTNNMSMTVGTELSVDSLKVEVLH